jgi:hypothetical protein
MLDQKRYLFKGLEEKLAKIFSVFPITPNQWTLISVLTALFSVYFLSKQKLSKFNNLFKGKNKYEVQEVMLSKEFREKLKELKKGSF